MTTSNSLEGKVIIIAGGAAGTGEAVSLGYAAAGAKVVIGDINVKAAEDVAHRIAAKGGAAEVIAYDTGDLDSVAALITKGAAIHGRLDGYHNIAGSPRAMAHDHDLLTTATDVWLTMFRDHFLASAIGCKTAIPIMLAQGGGAIILTSSGQARSAATTRLGYQVAKGGIETLTRHIAHTYGKQRVRCNALRYGLIVTEAVKRGLTPEFIQMSLESNWTPRNGYPQDIVGIATLLMSPASEYIQGQVIDISGGRLIGA